MLSRDDTDISFRLAVLLLFFGLVGLAVSILVPNPYSRTLPVAVLLAAGLYLSTRNTTPRQTTVDVSVRLLVALYAAVLATTVLLYHAEGARRTPVVHAFILACYALVAILILTPTSPSLKLSAVVTTGIAQRAMAYYASPLYLGNDVFAHNRNVQEIVASGSLAPLLNSRYYYAAFYHLLISIQSSIADISVRHAAFVTIAVVLVVIPATAVYLILDRIWSEQAALYGAFLYTGSDFAIHWAITPQVTSLGVAFYALAFLLLLLHVFSGNERYHLLYFVAFVAIALTHHASTFITFLTISIFLFAWGVQKPQFRLKALWLSGVSLVIMLVDFHVTQFGGPTGESESFFATVLSIWTSSLEEARLPGSSTTELPSTLALAGSEALNVWHVGGTAILLGLAVFGGLHWLSNSSIQRTTGIALGSIVSILFSVVLAGPVVGLRILIPWRWFAFLYLPLTILAAPGLVVLATAARDSFRRLSVPMSTVAPVLIILLLVGPYIFLMGGNSTAARDGPPLDGAPGAERYAITDAEQKTLEHAVAYVPEPVPILGDFMIAHNLLDRHYERENVRTIRMEDRRPSSIGGSEPAVLVNRSYMQSGHTKFRFGTEEGIGNEEGELVHGSIPVDKIEPHRQEVIYSTGTTELVRLSPPNADNRSTEPRVEHKRAAHTR